MASKSEDAASGVEEPVFEFLIQTLPIRRRINLRKKISYISIRSWRKPIAKHQIAALRVLKGSSCPSVCEKIASEIIDEINSVFGVQGFQTIVPMPSGHARSCPALSEQIAFEIGKMTGINVVNALSLKPRKGSSHPMENLRREKLTLARAPMGPVLLVDDVATSGVHMEEAVRLLRPLCSAVFAVAWISGSQ